jgi:hypothetical protein
LKGKKRLKISWDSSSLTGTLTVLAIVCIFAALGVGIVFLDKYVRKTAPVRETIAIELVGVPVWVNDQLKEKVYAAAVAGGEPKLDENTAVLVQQNIVQQVAWLDDVRVQTTHEGLRIAGRWRKPLAVVKSGLRKSYLDDERVVLDFVPMPNLPIVEVKGLLPMTKIPQPGEVWQRDDVAAAVAVISRLDRMDGLATPDKPLLREIDSIDVSNFNGRKNTGQPHIVLYTKDGTEVIWGAEIGMWGQHLEATDEDKLAKLYGYYKEYGSLMGRAKYINLRDPQDKIPLPIDKY